MHADTDIQFFFTYTIALTWQVKIQHLYILKGELQNFFAFHFFFCFLCLMFLSSVLCYHVLVFSVETDTCRALAARIDTNQYLELIQPLLKIRLLWLRNLTPLLTTSLYTWWRVCEVQQGVIHHWQLLPWAPTHNISNTHGWQHFERRIHYCQVLQHPGEMKGYKRAWCYSILSS